SMEPITAWSEERVSQWLQGLDAPLQQYPTSTWHLSGMDLLQLTSKDLENLGVNKIGHQELILEAVEKLCFLMYGIGGESLLNLTEKLRAVSHTLQMGIQGRWRINSYDGGRTTKLSSGVLQLVVELIIAAKGLLSLLNRYQFFQLTEASINKTIFTYCKELGDIVHKQNSTALEKEKDIISVCRQVTAVCDDILASSSEALLTHTTQLESVDLVPVSPGDKLGIEIASTGSSNHYVTGAAAEASSDVFLKVLAGDEVIQVNDQIVVSTAVRPQTCIVFTFLFENACFPDLGGVEQSKPYKEAAGESQQSHSGPEEDLRVSPTHQSAPGFIHTGEFDSLRLSPRPREDRSPSPRSPSPFQPIRSPSPQDFHPDTASISSCPEMVGQMAKKDREKSSLKGMTTTMSRRRVSCRELGMPDCDGWLWKKRKESSVFIAQKWQRFWFILKGPALYWYSSQQDEKAEGFINISSYNIEMDEMGVMMNSIKEGGVSLTGQEQPFTHDHFRRSFIRRCKNPVINEKVHVLRTLQSTLKAKEAELLQINRILEESELTASKFRQWKEHNEELVQEIERAASIKASKGDTTAENSPAEEPPSEPGEAETEGAYRLSLSDGEQLVDAEPSDVLLEMGSSPGLDISPMLELSLGSLQESINKELSDMAESGNPSESYFFI
ncbi:unnamed protein product, partial [Tetraodon nigroviridis]